MKIPCIKKLAVALTAGIFLFGLGACAQLSLFGANLPTQFGDIRAIRDVSFGNLETQKLDVYMPLHPKPWPSDVVVFFYGGRWEQGSKSDYRFVAAALVKQGFIVVVPDYRKYPDVHFPVFVQDGAKAVAWAYDHIGNYGGNPARIHLAGHSAGGHIASLITADPSYLAAEGKDRSKVVYDFAGLAGPYSFTPDADDLKDMFGPPENYPQMQATTFIDGRQPPMLLLYGDADEAVNISNLQKLEQSIHEHGGCVRSIIYPGVDHPGIIGALSWYNPGDTPVLKDVSAFFKADKHEACSESATPQSVQGVK